MRMGYAMRQQAIAICYSKVLNLNSSALADVSTGKVGTSAAAPLHRRHAYSHSVITPCKMCRHSCGLRPLGRLVLHRTSPPDKLRVFCACVCCKQITNLVSNDVRRFDDALPFWCQLWGAPLELLCVLVLLSMEVSPAAAFAGVATLLLVIPVQARTHVSHVPCMHDMHENLHCVGNPAEAGLVSAGRKTHNVSYP